MRKTGETGVIVGFVCYGTGQDGEKYDYTSVKVYFENKSGCRKNRRYSARSLIKLV